MPAISRTCNFSVPPGVPIESVPIYFPFLCPWVCLVLGPIEGSREVLGDSENLLFGEVLVISLHLHFVFAFYGPLEPVLGGRGVGF